MLSLEIFLNDEVEYLFNIYIFASLLAIFLFSQDRIMQIEVSV